MIGKFISLFLSEFLEKIFALILIILFLPLFLIISFLIFFVDGKEIFFSQIRVGLNAKYFKLYKFRTMRINYDEVQITSLNDPRITNLGKILRKFKIDELPQLFNIVNGTMSFVGYRPEVPKYVHKDNYLWKEVLKLKPDITSKVTILFRNEEDMLQNSSIDKEILYEKYILPFKLILTIRNNKNTSFIKNIKTIIDTIFFIIFPSFLKKLSEKDLITFVEGNNIDY